ncbi:MAG: hypothetical protein GY757_51925, partial [bacterium]|nr:hypothetical protein [bacterium]
MTNLIKDFPVPLVLKKILKDCISGELNVGFGSISKKFYFSKGRLEFASTTLLNERFGETMKARGKITPEQHK